MAHFVKHEPCPKCGSRDNLARYSDGAAYCFGCHYVEKPDRLRFKPSFDGRNTPQEPVPADLTVQIAPPNLKWLQQYLTNDEIEQNFKYSPARKRHIFIAGSFWEERSVIASPKSICHGTRPFLLHGAHHLASKGILLVVEDVVSAIKVGRHATSICLFGSEMNPDWLVWISKMGQVKEIVFWLDYDKTDEARSLARKMNLLKPGIATYQYTIKDPKDYEGETLDAYCSPKRPEALETSDEYKKLVAQAAANC